MNRKKNNPLKKEVNTVNKVNTARRIIAVLATFMFVMVVQSSHAEAITRICFMASSHVEGIVVTGAPSGGARTITLNATKFYHEPVSFAPDRDWYFDHVEGFGVYTRTVPVSYRDSNVPRSWRFFWKVQQGFTSGLRSCTTNS